MRRELTLLDCFGLGINGILGSGIFLLPATLFRRAGSRSPLSWLVVGTLCVLVALCFAEAAGRTEKSGGPYRYACEAFGPRIGFVVGWVTLTSVVLGYAAVSRGFAEHATWLLGRQGSIGLESAIAAGLIAVLAVVNVVGLKSSARTSDVVGFVKVGALLLFVGVGLFHLRSGTFSSAPRPHAGESIGVLPAAFAGLFACTGFEFVPVPAGETLNPRRAVGLAMVVSVVAATLLYAVVQIVAMGSVADLGESKTPLVDAARTFGGSAGATAMAVAAVVSAFGYCASSALVSPRYVESLAEDRFLPGFLETRSPRFGTPIAAIVIISALVMVLAVSLDFAALADTSNIAVVVQYLSTCVAIIVMRRRERARPRSASPVTSDGFRTPFGLLVPILAIVGSVGFLFSVAAGEMVLSLGLLGGGVVVGVVSRRFRRAYA